MTSVQTARAVGRATSPFKTVVERTKLAEYARALHLRNPIHWEPAAARAAGYRDVVAVPGFITSLTMHQRDIKFATFALNESKSLLGELRWEHRGIVCAGDELSGCSTLVDVSKKSGRRTMDVLVIETRLVNQFGDTVVVVAETHIEPED